MNNKHRTIFFCLIAIFARFLLTLVFGDCKTDNGAEKIIFFTKQYNISFASLVIDLESEKTINAYDKICLI